MSNAQTAPGTPTAGSSSNVVGVHYKVGKKIGEGSFGVIFEGEFQDWSGVSVVVMVLRMSVEEIYDRES